MQKKILVVDDEPHIVHLLSLRLEANDYQVLKAYDGVECLQIAQIEIPDLILLDISMPYKDGVQTFDELKQLDITKSIPIIFITAVATVEMKVQALNMGANDFIAKPFDSYELLKKIEELIFT